MGIPVTDMLTMFADASAASNAMREFVLPLMGKLIILASAVAVFFIAYGGIQHITSSGDPEKLDTAKRIIRNALIGLVIVIAAGVLTGILNHAYNEKTGPMSEHLPAIQEVQTKPVSGSAAVILDAMMNIFRHLVELGISPIIDSLSYFTKATPLMADNSGVFNLWLVVVGITDVLFMLVLALIGFHVMSFASLGFKELDLKHLIPRLVIGFLLINMSIFAIDLVISLSNAMISALGAAFSVQSAWEPIKHTVGATGALNFFTLIVMIAFLAFAVILLVYYVVRIVALYTGAVLSPLVFLLWLLPAFKDFANTAVRVYLSTVFVLLIHVVILLLSASLFKGVQASSLNQVPNALMSMILGIATLWSLLKTQSVMSQLTYASQGASSGTILARKIVQGFSAMGLATLKMGKGSGNNSNEKTDGFRPYQNSKPPGKTSGPFHKSESAWVGSDRPAPEAKSKTNSTRPKKTGETVQASPPTPATPAKKSANTKTKSERKPK